MTILQLQYFCEVYISHSTTAAANKFNVSQPSISISLRKLEDELGVQLFIRTTKNVIPTKDGDTLYEIAAPIVHSFGKIKERFANTANTLPTITLGTTLTSHELIIPDLLKNYLKIHPHILFNIETNTALHWIHAVENDSLPFAIITVLPEYKMSLDTHLMGYCELCINVSEAHPFAGKTSIRREELGNSHVISLNASAEQEAANKRAFGIPNQFTIASTSIATLKYMLQTSHSYCGLFSKELIHQEDHLCSIPLDPPFIMPMSFIWKRTHYFTPPEKAFLRYILKHNTPKQIKQSI